MIIIGGFFSLSFLQAFLAVKTPFKALNLASYVLYRYKDTPECVRDGGPGRVFAKKKHSVMYFIVISYRRIEC